MTSPDGPDKLKEGQPDSPTARNYVPGRKRSSISRQVKHGARWVRAKKWKLLFAFYILLPVGVSAVFYFWTGDIQYLVFGFGIISLAGAMYALRILAAGPQVRSFIPFLRTYNKTYASTVYRPDGAPPLQHLIGQHLVGLEVGVDEGENAQSILDNLNIEKLYLVDPWKEYVADHSSGHVSSGHVIPQHILDMKFERVLTRFADDPKVEILRKTSEQASGDFKDGFFDFIYLDGDHTYEMVKTDLECWYGKLKKYGVMCGDDYTHPSCRGVIEAVQEFAFEKKLFVQSGPDNQFWFVKTRD